MEDLVQSRPVMAAPAIRRLGTVLGSEDDSASHELESILWIVGPQLLLTGFKVGRR